MRSSNTKMSVEPNVILTMSDNDDWDQLIIIDDDDDSDINYL